MQTANDVLREPAETRYAEELQALESTDKADKPHGWRLSPRAVRAFIIGTESTG
jgi:hypothetical protein